VITHRPALLRLADSTVLMAEGHIAVQGVAADALGISACEVPPPERAGSS
jgi:ABC-type protease/lipase transport system fused ATPase/permease subunit